MTNEQIRQALEPLRQALNAITVEDGCTIFEHTAEEIGLMVMENHQAARDALNSMAGEVHGNMSDTRPNEALATHPAPQTAPASEDALREAVERFLADYDDGDRADAGIGPLMEAHVADFRAALSRQPVEGAPQSAGEPVGDKSGEALREALPHLEGCLRQFEEMDCQILGHVGRNTALKSTIAKVKEALVARPSTPPTDERHYLADHFEWAAPGDRQEDAWIVRFCDNDIGDMIFTGEDAEKQAWKAWEMHAPGYNMYLFRLAKLAPGDEREKGGAA